ncbi:hypothetical protein [Dactylosporangium sp. NPDC051541]|uniref:hypothetical protein n=1 Tax=Dactylosporangium sp. NPDC051541 TaxID=3363977 RepID=UPI0037898065
MEAGSPAGCTVLVVEDEPAWARVVTRILGKAGCHVMACANGEQALVADAQRPCEALLI